MESTVGLTFLVLMLPLYFLPWLVAGVRHHHNSGAIAVTNLLFGWTLLGWGIALIWACTAVKPAPAHI